MFHRRLCVTPSRDLPRAPCDRGAGVVARLSGRLLGCNTLNRVFLADPQQPLLHLPPTPPLPLAPISPPHPLSAVTIAPANQNALAPHFRRSARHPSRPTQPHQPTQSGTPRFSACCWRRLRCLLSGCPFSTLFPGLLVAIPARCPLPASPSIPALPRLLCHVCHGCPLGWGVRPVRRCNSGGPKEPLPRVAASSNGQPLIRGV